MSKTPIKTLVIKVGSNVLTLSNGNPDIDRMKHLAEQISRLRTTGIKVILISSGAVAFGKQEINLQEKVDPVLKKQIWASVGQISLIRNYQELFAHLDIPISQILVTKEDFRDRKHYLNMRYCIQGLLANDILPLINENDTVAITELMFTDNDELAGLTASMLNADSLIILSNVDGIFTGHPNEPASELIPVFYKKEIDLDKAISSQKSTFGRGGMLTKTNIALKTADLGIQVWIANGKKENVLLSIAEKRNEGSYFPPNTAKQSRKKWLAYGESYYKGEIVVNEGAKAALFSKRISSLLPVGIEKVSGDFSKGDILRIIDREGQILGLGKAAYSANLAKERLGQKNQKALIHYDYLYLYQHE